MAKKNITYPKDFLAYVQSITNKRAKIVIDHILKHGFITTDDLQTKYGYTHAPRAAMDVKDAGIPIETFKVKSNISGRQIGAYKFGDIATLQINRVAGRIPFSKDFKHDLYNSIGGRCQICNGIFQERYLQIDHRIPYEVAGDLTDREPAHFMLLCGSCNRAKSWSCEHCNNWRTVKKPPMCMECYWGNPTNYNHIAMEQVRRLDLQWNGDEIKYYDALKIIADQNNLELPEFIKKIIADITKRK